MPDRPPKIMDGAEGAAIPEAARGDEKRARAGFWPKLRRVARHIPFAADALALWYCAIDPQTPFSARATLWAAIAYFVSPVDLVPDFLPLIGFTDDAAVIALVLARLGGAIRPAHRAQAAAALAETLE